MYRETHYLDDWLTKASGFINIGSGIPKSKFTAHEEAKMLKLLDQLWGQQFDKVTQARVLEAMQIGDLPAGFLSDIDGSLTQWVESQFMPAYAKAMEYAAEGGGQVFGMMDDINRAVGGNILFNPSTQRMTDYINTHGLELAKQLNDGQVASLRTMLNDVLENRLTQRRAHDLMRKSISLTDQETKWLTNYRARTLDEQTKYFRKEFPNLNEREILKRANAVTDRRVGIKHKKYNSNRARRIMTTELTDAKHTADLESHKQAMDAGIIKEAEKKWKRNNYENNWDTSKWYDGKRIPIDQDFSQFGIPAKTSMTDFSMPREINENCKVIFYVKKGDGVPKPKPEAVKPKPKPKPKKPQRRVLRNKDEADKEMLNYFRGLSEKEMEAVNSYTGSNYKRWNKYLRTGDKSILIDTDLKSISTLKKVLNKAPAYEGEVLRGMGFHTEESLNKFLGGIKKDGITTLKGFTSTTASTKKSVYQQFQKGRHSIIFKIKSKNGVYLDGGSSMPSEIEVLFNDKSSFSILDIKKRGKLTTVIMEEIP